MQSTKAMNPINNLICFLTSYPKCRGTHKSVGPMAPEKGLRRVQAREVRRLPEYLRHLIVRLPVRHRRRPFTRRLQAPHHHRYHLPVPEEEPFQRRLHRLERLQDMHPHRPATASTAPLPEKTHRRLLHPRPAAGVRLRTHHRRHAVAELLARPRERRQTRRPELAGVNPQLVLQSEDVERVHQQVQIFDFGEKLPEPLEQPTIGSGLMVVLLQPVHESPEELAAGGDPALENLVRGEDVFVLRVLRIWWRGVLEDVEVGGFAEEVVVEGGFAAEVGLADAEGEGEVSHTALHPEPDLRCHCRRPPPRGEAGEEAFLARPAHRRRGLARHRPHLARAPATGQHAPRRLSDQVHHRSVPGGPGAVAAESGDELDLAEGEGLEAADPLGSVGVRSRVGEDDGDEAESDLQTLQRRPENRRWRPPVELVGSP